MPCSSWSRRLALPSCNKLLKSSNKPRFTRSKTGESSGTMRQTDIRGILWILRSNSCPCDSETENIQGELDDRKTIFATTSRKVLASSEESLRAPTQTLLRLFVDMVKWPWSTSICSLMRFCLMMAPCGRQERSFRELATVSTVSKSSFSYPGLTGTWFVDGDDRCRDNQTFY